MTLAMIQRPIPAVVAQHVEEAAILHGVRTRLSVAPHVRLHQLARWDERIAAHLDGIAVAGEYGWRLCEESLARPGSGEIFAATVAAIENRNPEGFAKLLAVAEALPEGEPGMRAALHWLSPKSLRGFVRDLLMANGAFARRMGIAACTAHGADPGAALEKALADDDPALRRVAVELCARLGRTTALPSIRLLMDDRDGEVAASAAMACVLLGERGGALKRTADAARGPGAQSAVALALYCKAESLANVHSFLRELARDATARRSLLRGSGFSGDAQYLPWLLGQMEDDEVACLAGESFSLITGLDLAYLDYELRDPPEKSADAVAEAEGAIPEDDSLPWPDVVKLREWWSQNKQRFSPGQRYFMGEPLESGHCARVLREGFQRQRICAAEHLVLLRPGATLFDTAAPAQRQMERLKSVP